MTATASFSGTGRALDEQTLEKVEAQLGVKLPDSLRSHYLQVNGGRPSPNIFVDGQGDDYEVHSFKSFGEPGHAGVSIEDTHRTLSAKGLIPPGLLPFAMDSGGNFYCIDESGRIFFLPMDVPQPNAIPIADTLQEFVEGLVTADEAYG